MQLGGVSSKISLKTLQGLLPNTTLQVKIRYYCAYISVFEGRKFKISATITYFDTFQVKTHNKI